jgi:predicted  nucleic acid-binding Zn-ribbon protein
LSSLRKEKEALLAEKEQSIAKRSVELNSVKSNDVYKAIALEIEKAKADKSMIEDQILELLMKVDEETRSVKEFEAQAKDFESKIKSEIADIEKSAIDAKEQIKSIEQERQKHKSAIDSGILEQYERLRQGGGQAISIVENNSCASCGVVLRPQMINQLQKGLEIIFCDGCSRILLKKD